MSVYLKCKGDGKKISVECKTTAEKPYLAVNYTTQTGTNSTDTTMSKGYVQLATNTDFVIPDKKIVINGSGTKFYVVNNTNTYTTTVASTETKYTGIAYIPKGEPIMENNKATFIVYTSTNCGGVSAGWVTTKYEYNAYVASYGSVSSSISRSITDYYIKDNNITFFKNNSYVNTTSTIVRASTSSNKSVLITDTAVTIITTPAGVGYLRELANDGKYLGLYSQTRYISSSSFAGNNNTTARKFPYKASYTDFDYETQTSSGTSFNHSCSEYVEEIITKTIISSITD